MMDPPDPAVLIKFKEILSPFIPIDLEMSDEVCVQFARVLHEGGLPFQLESQVASTLSENDRMMDNVKRVCHDGLI